MGGGVGKASLTIKVRPSTKERLRRLENIGDSYDPIIRMLLIFNISAGM